MPPDLPRCLPVWPCAIQDPPPPGACEPQTIFQGCCLLIGKIMCHLPPCSEQPGGGWVPSISQRPGEAALARPTAPQDRIPGPSALRPLLWTHLRSWSCRGQGPRVGRSLGRVAALPTHGPRASVCPPAAAGPSGPGEHLLCVWEGQPSPRCRSSLKKEIGDTPGAPLQPHKSGGREPRSTNTVF